MSRCKRWAEAPGLQKTENSRAGYESLGKDDSSGLRKNNGHSVLSPGDSVIS